IETEQTVLHCLHNQPNSNFLCTERQLIRLAAFRHFSLLRLELSPSSILSLHRYTSDTHISQIRFPAAQNNINTRFIILDKARSISSPPAASGQSCIALAADETAAVHIQLWGDECDAFEAGDIVNLTNGIFSYVRNGGLLLRAGKRGKMEKVGEFAVAFVETPNVSEIQWSPDPEYPKRYIQNGVVSAYSRIFPPLP
ncbi:unnamed protein product, partial [Brassica rapa]